LQILDLPLILMNANNILQRQLTHYFLTEFIRIFKQSNLPRLITYHLA